jgi:hypothetical protein
MTFFSWIRNKIVHAKVFAVRTMSYVAVANAIMLVFLTLTRLEDYGLNFNIENYFLPILLLGAVALIIIGYLEDKLGFHKAEVGVLANRNPRMDIIIKKLEGIEKRLDDNEKK